MFKHDDIWIDEMVNRLSRFGKIGEVLSEIFSHIEDRLNELDKRLDRIESEVTSIRGDLKKLESNIDQVMRDLSDVKDVLIKHDENITEILRRINNLELTVGAASESYFVYRFIQELMSREEIKRFERNIIINNEEIDAIIECSDKVYVVEVKIKPRISDIGALLAKMELYKIRVNISKQVIPVIIGVYIGKEVESYARRKNVYVYKF